MPESTDRSRLVAQIAAHESWAKTEDRSARTAPARAALEAKFLAEAGGDPQRAQSLRTAYYKRLALRSAQSRARKRAERAKSGAQAAQTAAALREQLRAGGGDAA